ncbi:MAG: phage integrase SAM-like domain-containing protein [Bacteroidota bacterium]
METHVTLSLDKRRIRKDLSYPIIFRITHRSKSTTSLSTGYHVPEKYWDDQKKEIKATYNGIDNIKRTNNHLIKEKAKIMDLLTKLDERGELNYLSLSQLKDKIVSRNRKETVFNFIQKIIDDMIKKQKIGNARSYKNVLREIKKFRKEVDLPFSELNYDFLLRFEKAYLARGNSENGLAVYMRTIRAIYNRAIKENIVDAEGYPFKNYIIKIKPTKKRAINYSEIKKLIDLKLKKKDALFDVRNFFLSSFYLNGAPFIDLAFLKVENITNGRVNYKRKKTGRYYDIKIVEPLQPILNHYCKGKLKDDYVFPIIKREKLEDQYKDIQWAQSRYNKRLKSLAQKAGIEEHLTSYVSRHSFASRANNLAIPITAISQMLGHERISTTQAYLADLNTDVLDLYSEKVLLDE